MLLYFPSVKVARCDLVPGSYGQSYLFHFKSTINSPKHFPDHPLIEGKIEFVGRINDAEDVEFWFKYCVNEDKPKNLKGKIVSILVDFDASRNIKFNFLGIGKKDQEAFFLFNKSMNLSIEENMAKLNYDLKPQKTADKKRIKV